MYYKVKIQLPDNNIVETVMEFASRELAIESLKAQYPNLEKLYLSTTNAPQSP